MELIAVASREGHRAEAHARTWDIPRSSSSYEALLDHVDIEPVCISLPNTLHCEWAIKADRRRGWCARGHRLLLRERNAHARWRTRERRRARLVRADGNRVFAATMWFSGDVLGLFDCGTALPRETSSR